MDITRASIEDAGAILELQKLAYRSEAELHGDFSIPPLLQTLDQLREEFGTRTVLKAVLDGRLVGSVRAWERDGTCHIGRLVVHPSLQGRGIGSSLMRAAEAGFPGAARFELFTGEKSARNIRLYEHLGYRQFRTERVSDRLTLVYLEKVVTGGCDSRAGD